MSTTTQQRATQGFVENLSWVRARPSLTAIEVAWRWAFGIPALLLIVYIYFKVPESQHFNRDHARSGAGSTSCQTAGWLSGRASGERGERGR